MPTVETEVVTTSVEVNLCETRGTQRRYVAHKCLTDGDVKLAGCIRE